MADYTFLSGNQCTGPMQMKNEKNLEKVLKIKSIQWNTSTNIPTLAHTIIKTTSNMAKISLTITKDSYQITKNIYLIFSVTTRISCPMDFTAYPFDSQTCYYDMESCK